MEQFELPPRPTGTLQDQLTQLWETLFRLTEQLNARAARGGRDGT